ncbi:Uncharacterized protein TCM_040415 [Theobroma cacao]|uniref:Uncharacterized protein n=1 Tax=Theobroma cacao TaxID=3641 RepID=A0A061GTH6_THECC|nr:Uncharacterized protein TCM_040415 [Theobroma cacao]
MNGRGAPPCTLLGRFNVTLSVIDRAQSHSADGQGLIMCGGAPTAHVMSRKDGSPDTPHSTSKRSLDSTAQSRYMLKGESITSNLTQFLSGSVPPRGKPLFKSLMSLARLVRNEINPRKKNTNKMEKKRIISNYRPTKVSVSVVRNFPPGCGRGGTPVSKEEFERNSFSRIPWLGHPTESTKAVKEKFIYA